jgi:polysaccharide chain length determinant protein (PEP-CTERM system associated)
MPQNYSHPLNYLRVLRRRKWWFAIPALLCIAGGIAAARLLPPTYKTVATVAVQAPTVTPDLVAQRAALNTEERLRALTQQLRSPLVLERVVREEALTTDRPVDAVVQELRTRITIEPMKPITRTEAVATLNAFDIVYRDSTPQRTQRVADRLAAVFVEEHSHSRAVQAEGTTEFLRTQLQSSQERLANLEKQLRRVKEVYMGQLPEQTEANMQALGALRQQLDTTGNNLRYEQDRLSFVERQIQAVRQGAASAPAASASGGAPSPQQRINTLQRDLAAARSKYTDKHPEVLALEDELKIARADAAALRGQSDSSREEQLGTDPVYQQLTSDRSMAQARIRNLQRAEGQLRSDMARYQGRVEAAPMVEQELAGTQREYDLERENYKNLSERHAAAQMQAQLAEQRGGERFSVLNKAFLPASPESPNRLAILLVAFGVGLVLGGAAALGREYLDPAVRDARSLQDDFDVPVLAEIPRIRDVA